MTKLVLDAAAKIALLEPIIDLDFTFDEIFLMGQYVPTKTFLKLVSKCRKLKLIDCKIGKYGDWLPFPSN